MSKESLYQQLGVDAQKEGVKKAFKKIIDNEYPNAFVNIITDPYDPELVMTQHQDGDGSKFVQRLLHYRETGDASIFDGMVDDALSMNTGDIAASGFVFGHWLISDVLNVNLPTDLKNLVMKRVARRFAELKKLYQRHGFHLHFLGGETADLKDQVKSAVFDITVTAREKDENIITGNVEPGNMIFGFSSAGKAVWEKEENSGLMSNGLTLARSSLMCSSYNEKYPDLRRDNADFYKGDINLTVNPALGVEISKKILSPTRQWAIVIRKLIEELKKREALHFLHGITMNTGGGATKIKNIGQGIVYIKDMPTPPEIFQLIQKKSGEDWKNMYETFNCGIGIDVVGEKRPAFIQAVEETAKKCQIWVHILGSCAKNDSRKNAVIIHSDYGVYSL